MAVERFKHKLLFAVFLLAFIAGISICYSPQSNFWPLSCQDSDGDCNPSRINASDSIYEMVDLLTYPYGWIIAENFAISIPDANTIDSAAIHVLWYSDTEFGATNIYIDYWNTTAWHTCAGPFQENATLSDTTCNISSLSKDQLNSIKVRIRGEDTDGFPPALIYVDAIMLEVNHSSPPLWRNQTTNVTYGLIYVKDSIKLSVEAFDDVGLAYAWLETNETGEWKNYTDGTYGSPVYLDNLANSWTWVNFTWKNDSFISGSVAWRIYMNDSTGKENVTDVNAFYVQFRKLPVDCQDSDGDCNPSRINASDSIYEMVDLLTYPYGWINATAWDLDVPENTVILSAYLHVLWYSDTEFGATNIYIDYWNTTAWHTCAGPFQENATLSDTTCNISSLSKDQLNSIKVRIRGEDTDGFPPALIYVDQVYIVANYSIGYPYLEVNLALPQPSQTTNVVQNKTFIVNATVYCRGADCGGVYATLRYNLTSAYPDTPINVTEGDKPFYVQEPGATATKSCPTNPMSKDEFCNVTWVLNSTGSIGSSWKLGVLFNSLLQIVEANHTENATVYIVPCIVDFTLQWSSINFGELIPNTYNNSAPGNADNAYNITVNDGSCNLNLYIRGSDLVNSTYGWTIKVGNISWSNISSNVDDGYFSLSETDMPIQMNVYPNTNVTTWYWLNVPPVYAGYYNGTIYITGVESD